MKKHSPWPAREKNWTKAVFLVNGYRHQLTAIVRISKDSTERLVRDKVWSNHSRGCRKRGGARKSCFSHRDNKHTLKINRIVKKESSKLSLRRTFPLWFTFGEKQEATAQLKLKIKAQVVFVKTQLVMPIQGHIVNFVSTQWRQFLYELID